MDKWTTECIFSAVCNSKDYDVGGCPFCLSPISFKKKLLPINCSTWNAHRKSAKGRRLDYAEKAKHRREIERSKGQIGDVTA